MMDDQLKSFIAEGLKRYPDALATVSFFEQQVQRCLEEIVRRQDLWRSFSINELTPGRGSSGMECWMYAWVTGTLDNVDVTIDCGVWWNPQELPGHSLVAYAGFDEPETLRTLAFVVSKADVHQQRRRRNSRLYVDMPNEADLKAIFETLLGELEDNGRRGLNAGRGPY